MSLNLQSVSLTPSTVLTGANFIISVEVFDDVFEFDMTGQKDVHQGFGDINQTVGGKFAESSIETPATWAVEEVSGASYGFVLNSEGYYESNNKGRANSAALCKVVFNLPKAATVKFQCINYAESNYDYGILGNVDSTLSTSYSADSSYKHSFKGKQMSTVQEVSYDMEAGEHFMYVKYRKDSSVDSNNDSLQFKVVIDSGS